ncbi:MAG: tRNA pseudouridine(38-40) synthase TruA [Oscillospiraceae bacterium]|nr:tRNA pseudouridine(38-40) synthase TruA [Oscillospiraceae bacterium]
MRNLLFKIAYKGTAYHGWQVQSNALTVQEVVCKAVERVMGRHDVSGCSRLDAAVHANAYYFNIITESSIPCGGMAAALNIALPGDISVLDCRQVPMDFHPRYSACKKEYIYKIWNSPHRNPFMEGLVLNYKYPLDIDRINAACLPFIGTHDFIGFCSSGANLRGGSVRTIFDMKAVRDGELVTISVTGDGFLYNMVRIMTGTLIYKKGGCPSADEIAEIIESKSRGRAGKTAPACGLYLNEVYYK